MTSISKPSDEDDKVAITHPGTIETQEIERHEKRQYEETMRRLGT